MPDARRRNTLALEKRKRRACVIFVSPGRTPVDDDHKPEMYDTGTSTRSCLVLTLVTLRLVFTSDGVGVVKALVTQ